jgi:transcriptional regulator with XRE-family HTH domain
MAEPEPTPRGTTATSSPGGLPRVDELPFLVGVALALRAGRRQLGLSQRGFAAKVGLSKSAVARVETATPGLLVETVADALAGVGLRLCVADDEDHIWDPATGELDVDKEDARDSGGRRLPAHLTTRVWWHEPYWRFQRRLNRADRQLRTDQQLRTDEQPPSGRRDATKRRPVRPVSLLDRSLSYETRQTTRRRLASEQPIDRAEVSE